MSRSDLRENHSNHKPPYIQKYVPITFPYLDSPCLVFVATYPGTWYPRKIGVKLVVVVIVVVSLLIAIFGPDFATINT